MTAAPSYLADSRPRHASTCSHLTPPKQYSVRRRVCVSCCKRFFSLTNAPLVSQTRRTHPEYLSYFRLDSVTMMIVTHALAAAPGPTRVHHHLVSSLCLDVVDPPPLPRASPHPPPSRDPLPELEPPLVPPAVPLPTHLLALTHPSRLASGCCTALPMSRHRTLRGAWNARMHAAPGALAIAHPSSSTP